MIVVSDTSPLNYLVLIESEEVLPKLFGRILIPRAVHDELRSPAGPERIKRFLATEPSWLEIHPSPDADDDGVRDLDAGEREAISLALTKSADLVLLDERRGRKAAREHGLAVSGTLGVLDRAAEQGLLASCLHSTERSESGRPFCAHASGPRPQAGNRTIVPAKASSVCT
jgi:predicted nucleic acid-binding protein